MEQDKGNPYLQIPNPFEELAKSQENLQKHHPELQEFARLCYEIYFVNPDGKKLLNILKDRYLESSLVHPHLGNADLLALYWTGYTDCIKTFIMNGKQHKMGIVAV